MIKFTTYKCTIGEGFIFVYQFMDERNMWTIDGKKPKRKWFYCLKNKILNEVYGKKVYEFLPFNSISFQKSKFHVIS
jgi:hypothetical protein